MKKIISSILIISILITLIVPFNNVKAEGENIIFSLSSNITELVAGDTIEVNISMELLNSAQVNGLDMILDYDSEILEFNTDEGFYTSRDTRWSEPTVGYGEGTMHIISTRESTQAAKQGLVYTIYFNVLQDASETTISLKDIVCSYVTQLFSAQGNELIIPNVAATYTITYDSNTTNEVTNMPSNDTKTKDVDYTIGSAPTREGYSFMEWNTAADGSGTSYEEGATYSGNEDLTLYAQWKKQSTLTINPNGGVWEGSTATQTFTQDEQTTKIINAPTTVPNGNVIRFNSNGGTVTTIQERQTTTFAGWTGGSLSGTIYTFGTNDVTLTANYQGNAITLPMATKTGSIFLGWEDSNGNFIGEAGENYAPEYTTPNAIIILSAVYGDEPRYTLTIDANGGLYDGDTTVKGIKNSTVTLSDPNPLNKYTVYFVHSEFEINEKHPMYTFDKWTVVSGEGTINGSTYTFAEGDGKIKADYILGEVELESIDIRDGYTALGWYDENGNKIESPYIPISEETVLHIEWEPNTYTVTFDPGTNESISQTSKTVTYNQQYGTLPVPAKEGYTFKEWKTEDGTVITETDIVNITSNIKLYAEYEINTYFVTFKNDDGTEIKTIKIEHGSDAKFNGELPTKEGVEAGYEAIFTGWDNEENLKNITQNVTVTATYEVSPIVYTITYYNLKEADNSNNPTTYTIESENINLADLQNQGKYIFKGWYTSNEEDAEKVINIDTSKLGNIVLYAQWENDKLYLSSEKYKVGKNDIDNYEDGDIYLDKIEPNTTVAELVSNCDTNGIITVIDEEGNVLEEDDLVGTKMTIKVTRYDEQITLTAIVMGDLNGDGTVTATDLSTLNQTILYRKTLEEPRFKAADLDDNEKLTATDLSTINNTILGTINLTYSKGQVIKSL